MGQRESHSPPLRRKVPKQVPSGKLSSMVPMTLFAHSSIWMKRVWIKCLDAVQILKDRSDQSLGTNTNLLLALGGAHRLRQPWLKFAAKHHSRCQTPCTTFVSFLWRFEDKTCLNPNCRGQSVVPWNTAEVCCILSMWHHWLSIQIALQATRL